MKIMYFSRSQKINVISLAVSASGNRPSVTAISIQKQFIESEYKWCRVVDNQSFLVNNSEPMKITRVEHYYRHDVV